MVKTNLLNSIGDKRHTELNSTQISVSEPKSRTKTIQELATEITKKVDSGEVVSTELATSQRIIARVTDGIYREPWAAFRELVANAYDADATRVIVETGAPDFVQVIVRDNGNGMSPETVAYILKSIGGSSKRTRIGADLKTVSSTNVDISPGGRPLIGKIGIGLFAVAQLTQHFQIITKEKGNPVRTSATIRLRTHDEERISENDETEFVAGDVSITSETVQKTDIETHGTTIVLYSLRPEIRRTLQSVRRWRLSDTLGPDSKPVRDKPEYHIGALPDQIPGRPEGIEENLPWAGVSDPIERFYKLIDAAADVSGRSKAPANLEHFDEYLRLIWQLSLSLPLKYPEKHPFDFTGSSGLIFLTAKEKEKASSIISLGEDETIRKKLKLIATDENKDLPFNVIVDGVKLQRPIVLPTELRRKSRLSAPMMFVGKVKNAFAPEDLERAGGQLSFEAYLYWNSQIIPKETSGVLLRVREASGTLFDRSFLDYQISEQNRLSQITAEIFVHDGLDSAINIDRESFNFSHPHFLYIQKWLHRALRLLINKNKVLASEDLKKEKQTKKAAARQGILQKAVTVWEEQRGEEADVPVVADEFSEAPKEVGGVPIEWGEKTATADESKRIAIAIVLEAYGVLAQLDSNDRARIIDDLLKVLNETV